MAIFEAIGSKFKNRSRRWKGFTAFFSTSFAARGVSIACQTLQIPIALHALGVEGFGYWMTLTSINYMMNFADLGLGMGLQNKLADAFAKDKMAEAKALFGNTFCALCAIGLCLAVLGGGVIWLIDFPAAFHLHDPYVIKDAGAGALISLLAVCVGMPLGLDLRIAYSRQLGWWHNVAQATSAVLTVASLAVAAHLHVGFAAFFITSAIPFLLINVVLTQCLCRNLGWRSWRGFKIDIRVVKDVLSLGAHFSVQQVLSTVLYASPPIIISSALGAAAVTPYNLLGRLFNLFSVAQNAFMNGLWPIYSEAQAKGENNWIRRTLWRSCLATFVVSVIPLTVGAIFAKPIIQLWVGRSAPFPGPSLVWLIYAWYACQFIQQPFWFMLAGVSQIKRLTTFSFLAALVCFVSMSLLVHPLGTNGVIIGLLLGYVPFLLMGSIGHVIAYFRTFDHLPTDTVAMPADPPLAG
jgi:O-antigen/teichoic acid export membrane protein